MNLNQLLDSNPWLYACAFFILLLAIILGWVMFVMMDMRKKENEKQKQEAALKVAENAAFEARHRAVALDLPNYAKIRLNQGVIDAKSAFPEVHEHIMECQFCQFELQYLNTTQDTTDKSADRD